MQIVVGTQLELVNLITTISCKLNDKAVLYFCALVRKR